ncbi:MAG: MDR family MFS transporter [Candidatus Zixiibacteriota bacterium]
MIGRIVTYVRQFDNALWILSFGWVISAIGFSASIPFIAIFFHAEYGLSASQIGMVFGVLAIARSIFQAVGGEISDRVERRKLLVIAQGVRAIAFAALVAAVAFDLGFWAVSACLLLQSVFGSVFMPAAYAMVTDILPKERHMDGYAITRSAGNLGWAVGPAIGGFLLHAHSYAALFIVSAIMTALASAVFGLFLHVKQSDKAEDRFHIRDLVAVKKDSHLAAHSTLSFLLYLVVAQLIMTFSLYSVEMVGISQGQLGILYTLNGLMVALLQIPVTRMLRRLRMTTQLAVGALLYAIGYSLIGFFPIFGWFAVAFIVITLGEVAMSPPSLSLTARLAPKGRMGRYMGVYGFFVASGWSLGPLYGGLVLEQFSRNYEIAWMLISSLALVSMAGYFMMARRLPAELNAGEGAT